MDRAPADAGPFTLLIVDDDTTLQHALASVLTPLGYRVLTAANADQAYAHLGAGSVHAVLLDVRLPEVSGFELHLVIAQRWPALETRMAIMTGDADAEDVRLWRGLRRFTLFRKPFHPQEIFRWLEALRQP